MNYPTAQADRASVLIGECLSLDKSPSFGLTSPPTTETAEPSVFSILIPSALIFIAAFPSLSKNPIPYGLGKKLEKSTSLRKNRPSSPHIKPGKLSCIQNAQQQVKSQKSKVKSEESLRLIYRNRIIYNLDAQQLNFW